MFPLISRTDALTGLSDAPVRLRLAQEQAFYIPVIQTVIAASAFLAVLAGVVFAVRNRRRDGFRERLADAARVLRAADIDLRRAREAELPATTAELERQRARRLHIERALDQCPGGWRSRRLRSRLSAVADQLTRYCSTGTAPLAEIEAAYAAARSPDDVPAEHRLRLFALRVRQQERAAAELAIALRRAETTIARRRRF